MEIQDWKQRAEEARALGLRHQEDYERVLAEIAALRLRKAHTYGEARYEEPDTDFNVSGVLWDVYRKFIRLRQLFRLGWRKMYRPKEGDGLRDALLDMANYCLMGVQLMDRAVPPPPQRSPFFIEQVALKVPDLERAQSLFATVMGADVWHEDRVTATGTVAPCSGTVQSVAQLRFNYQVGPFELELLKYEDGPNWHEERTDAAIPYGLSHMGLHVGPDVDLDGVVARMEAQGYAVAQRLRTRSHTNPAISGKRWYSYVIFDTHGDLGFDLKLIQRLNSHGTPWREGLDE